MKSADLHDAKVEKPRIYEKGLSDIVMVFSVKTGYIGLAQWGKDGWWHGEGDETFGDVTHWYDKYPIPHNMSIDYSYYGGEL